MINSENDLKSPLAIDQDLISVTLKFKMILAPGKYTLWFYFNGTSNDRDNALFAYATYQAYFTINVKGASVYSLVPVHLPATWLVN